MSAAPKHEVRCEFTYSDGRRCRQSRRESGASFCFRHGRCEQQKKQAQEVGDEIVGAEGALNTQEGIHNALASVFCNLARNRISARNAAVLGYVGQLMLVHCPSLERMIQSYLPIIQLAMKTKQQMDQSGARADRHERHLVELQFDLLDRILLLARSDQIKDMPDEARRQISEAIAAAFKKEGARASAKP